MLLFTDIRPHSQVEVATSNSRKALRIVALGRETQRSGWTKDETGNINVLHLYAFNVDVRDNEAVEL